MLAVAERLRGGWSIAAFECWRLKPETIWGTPGGADVEAGAAESLWKVSKKEAKQAIGSAGVSLCFSFSSQKGQGKCFHSKASFGRSGARDTNAGSRRDGVLGARLSPPGHRVQSKTVHREKGGRRVPGVRKS